MRRTRAAVKAEERDSGPVADRPVPGLVAAERDPTFLDAHGYSGVTYAAVRPPSTTNVAAFT
jgi:hypothetical protein